MPAAPDPDVEELLRRLGGQVDGFDASGWEFVSQVRNPWGRVPMTGSGESLDGGSREYMDRLRAMSKRPDPESRRHHYVPRAYLKRWGFGNQNRRVWNLDTVTRQVRALSVNDVCVQENFYRVVGPDGEPHNRVEAMFGVVDAELGRIQALFEQLRDPDELEFDDLMGLGVTVAVQRMRTAQQRRLRLQQNAWMQAQVPGQSPPIRDPDDPLRESGIHTELLFKSMWGAADVMTTRSIEIWDDPEGRFWTCDTPVLVPFHKNKGPHLLAAPYILWPVSPFRVVALTNEPSGEKAVIRLASPKDRGLVRDAVEQGRERWIFASADQKDRLPATKKFGRRTQMRIRCSQWSPSGEYVKPPGCCVEMADGFSVGPDVRLCGQGLHAEAPQMGVRLMAVFFAEFEALSVRCRDTGGGLAAFMADLRVQQLGWPEDVVEQRLYDHAGVWSFQNDYSHIDLQNLAWSDELLASADFGTMSTGASDGDLLEDNAAKYEHLLRARQYTDIPAYWDEHGTWKRRPLLIDRSQVVPGGAGLQVIEGRTRVGILRGLFADGRPVAPEHAVWVARPR